MYQELEKLYNIKLPVKNHSILTEHFLKRNMEDDSVKFLIDNFILMLEKDYSNKINLYIKDKQRLLNFLIDIIKKSDIYNIFNAFELPKVNKPNYNNVVHFHTNDKEDVLDYDFIGVDIVEANFNAFKLFMNEVLTPNDLKNIFKKCPISSKIYTSNDFKSFAINVCQTQDFSKNFLNVLLDSKSFRQVVFGNLNPKKSMSFLYYIMNIIKSDLEDTNFELIPIIENQDAIVYATKNKTDLLPILFKRKEIFHDMIRVENLTYEIIESIKSNPNQNGKKYYIENNGSKRKLKGVPKNIYIPMYVKYILKEDIEENDLYQEIDGNVYKFIIFDNEVK